MEPIEEDIAIGTTPVQYITQGAISAINQYYAQATRMLDIEDFDYNEGKNLLTLIDDLPMYIPQQALDVDISVFEEEFRWEVDHRLDKVIHVRNEATGNTVTFSYQSLEYTIKAYTTKPDTIACHYVVQPGTLWNSKLHNDKGQPLKLILTYEIIQA